MLSCVYAVETYPSLLSLWEADIKRQLSYPQAELTGNLMDIPTFVQSMTIWNWLALVAFIFFPLSALNAFFGLRSRYRDWRGTKSRIQFDKRLKQFGTQLANLEELRADQVKVLVDGIRLILLVLVVTMMAIICFAIAFFLSLVMRQIIIETLFCISGIVIMFGTINMTITLFTRFGRISHPDQFAVEVIDFVKSAEDKGLKSDGADSLILRLVHGEMFTETEKVTVMGHFIRQLPRLAVIDAVNRQQANQQVL